MAKNVGSALATSLGPHGNDTVWISYEPGARLRYEVSVKGQRKRKHLQSYIEDDEYEYEYELQFAPHHLIPGNESLKGSGIVPFLGDDNVIEHFKGFAFEQDQARPLGRIRRQSGFGNGVWLPSPYALSNQNEWPATVGIAKVRKRRGGAEIARQMEEFKTAYAAAAVERTGLQFHMRHTVYSKEVRKAHGRTGRAAEAVYCWRLSRCIGLSGQ